MPHARLQDIGSGTGCRAERGQASVELVAALPAVLLLAAIVWQLALSGHAAWAAAHAARSAARAQAVGRSAEAAARSALPGYLERELRVGERAGGRAVKVSLRIPLLHPGWRGPVVVSAVAGLGGER